MMSKVEIGIVKIVQEKTRLIATVSLWNYAKKKKKISIVII